MDASTPERLAHTVRTLTGCPCVSDPMAPTSGLTLQASATEGPNGMLYLAAFGDKPEHCELALDAVGDYLSNITKPGDILAGYSFVRVGSKIIVVPPSATPS